MYRYRHTRLKLVSMLSRGHLSSTTRHIECSISNVRVGMQLAACANGVRMGCLAGCPRSCGAVRARRSSAPRHGAASSSSLTQATWDAQIVPDSGFHLPGSGAKLIAPIQGANITGASRGGDLVATWPASQWRRSRPTPHRVCVLAVTGTHRGCGDAHGLG